MDGAREGRDREVAELCRRESVACARWAEGYGVITHTDETQARIADLAQALARRGTVSSRDEVYETLALVDRLTSAAMWLVVHATYADTVYSDGRSLDRDDFKPKPEGHTGGALNMVPAYVGYLAANALTGLTRGWMMGQGHCVSAIDAANVLTGNLSPTHAERYSASDDGLTRFVRDFYSYRLRPDGEPESPLGSHVNVHTAGGLIEGGYLGFAELLWVHAPQVGERLVAFLSDGAFEEQRGGDWAPRWWRGHDSGLVCPILIANGRRIDQRTTLAMQGGSDWMRDHLRLNGFDPIEIDGKDPAAFVWAIIEIEDRLRFRAEAVERGELDYPIRLPYAIAETVKGFGFAGSGTNRAHNLPLAESPYESEASRAEFNESCARLHVTPEEVERAARALRRGVGSERPAEKDHPLVARAAPAVDLPEPNWLTDESAPRSVMESVDEAFVQIVTANPDLRVRVGNPDELRSNRMNATLDLLKHRVCAPEPGIAEAQDGGVITALNEEAVVCAALGNKGGLNIVVTYEAFGTKMHGALRQEIIFARQQLAVGRGPSWISVPVVLTSHTWENGKNEQSHQDPSLAESLMSEMTDVSRVFFPVDGNSAVACLRETYRTRCQIHAHVIPKGTMPIRFGRTESEELVRDGAAVLRRDAGARITLAACGSYQLLEVERASARLADREVPHSVVCLLEPGRFRNPRDGREAKAVVEPSVVGRVFPGDEATRVFVVHTRPELFLGTVRRIDTGPERTTCLGYLNRGGTLDAFGMLFTNRSTWAHIVDAAARLDELDARELLDEDERDAVAGIGDPEVIRRGPKG